VRKIKWSREADTEMVSAALLNEVAQVRDVERSICGVPLWKPRMMPRLMIELSTDLYVALASMLCITFENMLWLFAG
jgi:hypothetical protein